MNLISQGLTLGLTLKHSASKAASFTARLLVGLQGPHYDADVYLMMCELNVALSK